MPLPIEILVQNLTRDPFVCPAPVGVSVPGFATVNISLLAMRAGIKAIRNLLSAAANAGTITVNGLTTTATVNALIDALPSEQAEAEEVHEPVATTAALKAISADQRIDKMLCYVEANGFLYSFDAQSAAADNGTTILAPDAGAGRWLAVGSAVAGTTNISFTVNSDAIAATNEDPSLILAGGDGAEVVATTLRSDSSADRAYLSQRLGSTDNAQSDRGSEVVIGPMTQFTAAGVDADATVSLRGHAAGDAVGTFKTASFKLDSSALDLVITGPAGGAISAATNLDAEAGLDVTGGALTANVGAGIVDVDTTSGAITLDTTTGGISFDAQEDSNYTVTAADKSLTLSTAGGGVAQKLVLTSAGSGVDAVDIDASAGGIALDAAGAVSIDAADASNVSVSGAGADLTLASAGGRVVADGGEAAADALRLVASDAMGGIDVDAGTGGITLDTGGEISIGAGGPTSDFTVTSGNLTISTSGTGTLLLRAAEALNQEFLTDSTLTGLTGPPDTDAGDLAYTLGRGGFSVAGPAGAGGALTFVAGDGGDADDTVALGGAGSGGSVILRGGAGGDGADGANPYNGAQGGSVTVAAWQGGAGVGAVDPGDGGVLQLMGGDCPGGGSGNGNGGGITITGGGGSGTGVSGGVIIDAGAGGTAGDIDIGVIQAETIRIGRTGQPVNFPGVPRVLSTTVGVGRSCVGPALYVYDFATLGGAVGDIVLDGDPLPAGAVIRSGMVEITTGVTGGAGSTLALRTEAANDIVTASAVAGWGAGAMDVIPVGTAATRVLTSVSRQLVLTVAVDPLTAGRFVVALDYFLTA